MTYYRKTSVNKEPLWTRKSILSTASPEMPLEIPEFYELEPAVVVRVILKEDDKSIPKSDGKLSSKDYSYIGRVVCRPIFSHEKTPEKNLPIALPIETNIVEYPLKNEMVIVAKYLGKYYYSRKLNAFNLVNTNFDYRWNREYGERNKSTGTKTRNATAARTGNANVSGGSSGGDVVDSNLGEYFKENIDVRPLKPFEGDSIFQSRFGSSIRMGAYNDGEVNSHNGEHPQILIRNRQYDDAKSEEFGYPVEEDVNEDGSSIQITSGEIKSLFVPTTEMKFGYNEYPPELKDDQILVNSGRIILSSKQFEIFGFGKKTIGWLTDGMYTVDAKKDIVMNTEKNMVVWSKQTRINSDKIYVGEELNEEEPLVLGTQLYTWLGQLCDALVSETHTTATGPSGPPINMGTYISLKSRLRIILSKRAFVV